MIMVGRNIGFQISPEVMVKLSLKQNQVLNSLLRRIGGIIYFIQKIQLNLENL